MATIPDLASGNPRLDLAWEFAEHTSVSIFLTGRAGTGKTTFLRRFREQSAKAMIVVAPTGVAAINAGGVTIHSFFQLLLSPYVPGSRYEDRFTFSKEKLRIIRALDLLVIDEISMVRADLLDAVDNALKKYRRSSLPFGGVQLLMIGDLQQLAPVVTPADEQLLRDHYPTPYFFASRALQQIRYVTIALDKVYRQTNGPFLEVLNHVRDNKLTDSDLQLLASRVQPDFVPAADSGYIRLTTHNGQADQYNASRMAELPSPECHYHADVSGQFPETSFPTPLTLTLKKGAQVMFLKNDPSPEHRFYNGKIGTIVSATAGLIRVKCEGDDEPIDVTPMDWENSKYTVDEATGTVITEVQGSFKQMPLRPAWAITIHKSQGLTFDKAVIDSHQAFAPGQVYVALSRCKTLEGLVLASPIPRWALQPDSIVSGYIDRQDEEARRSTTQLDALRREYYRHLLQEVFRFGALVTAHSSMVHQMVQTYRVQFSMDTQAQQKAENELHDAVVSVADKWIALIAAMDFEKLQTPETALRIKSSAKYFAAQLRTVFGDSLGRLRRVRTGDKKANQRFADTLGDVRRLLATHLEILDKVAALGFSLESYLRIKQSAILEASRTGSLASIASRRSSSTRKTSSASSSHTSSRSGSSAASSSRSGSSVSSSRRTKSRQ